MIDLVYEPFGDWLFEQYLAGREDSAGDFARAMFDNDDQRADLWALAYNVNINEWHEYSGYHPGFKMAVSCWRLTLQDREEQLKADNTLTRVDLWGRGR